MQQLRGKSLHFLLPDGTHRFIISFPATNALSRASFLLLNPYKTLPIPMKHRQHRAGPPTARLRAALAREQSSSVPGEGNSRGRHGSSGSRGEASAHRGARGEAGKRNPRTNNSKPERVVLSAGRGTEKEHKAATFCSRMTQAQVKPRSRTNSSTPPAGSPGKGDRGPAEQPWEAALGLRARPAEPT